MPVSELVLDNCWAVDRHLPHLTWTEASWSGSVSSSRTCSLWPTCPLWDSCTRWVPARMCGPLSFSLRLTLLGTLFCASWGPKRTQLSGILKSGWGWRWFVPWPEEEDRHCRCLEGTPGTVMIPRQEDKGGIRIGRREEGGIFWSGQGVPRPGDLAP